MENLQLPQGLSPQGQNAGAEDESKRKVQEDDMRRDMMATILDTGARERCSHNLPLFASYHSYSLFNVPWTVSRIALVSPERSRQIETIIMRMAQSGQLRERVSEKQLIDLLDQVCSPSLP